MKIIRFEETESYKKLYTLMLDYDTNTKILSGTVGTQCGNVNNDLILEFSYDLTKYKNQIYDLTICVTDKGYELGFYDALKNYSMANGLPSSPHERRSQYKSVFRICCHDNPDESVIYLRNAHEEIKGFENIVETEDPSIPMYNLAKYDPIADKIIKKARHKSDMLGKIDIRDSISYLEAQVDLLTRVLLKYHPELNDDLVYLLSEADKYSVLDIKSEESVLEELLDKKSRVRQAQREYYEAKHKTTSD